MSTVVSFVVGLGFLIAFHELGHYLAAKACGVKTLRFSIGFGPALLRWRYKPDGTEFVLAAVPLGGYVRMLDERDGTVSEADLPRAFNRQSLRSRSFIVAAGPVANLLLAVLLYAAVAAHGVEKALPVLATPTPGSMAETAGLRAGDRVLASTAPGKPLAPVETFEEFRWAVTEAAIDGNDLLVEVVERPGQQQGRELTLPLSRLKGGALAEDPVAQTGITGPLTQAVLGEVLDGGAAQQASLMPGDRIMAVNGIRINDAQQLRALIREGVQGTSGVVQTWQIDRGGSTIFAQVTPRAEQVNGLWAGKIGAYIGSSPETVHVQASALEALWSGMKQTWGMAALSLKMIGKMVVGEASVKHLSGPLSIADQAGRAADVGWLAYLTFLALISVSLGVLNLLPVPILDGGHLMYHLYEAVFGCEPPAAWQERFQRGGLALLMGVMAVALFNDVARFLG